MVQWLTVDLPPLRILSGPYRGRGSAEQMEQQLLQLLPQYRHRSRFVSFERGELLHSDSSQLSCSFGLIGTVARRKQMLLSLPASLVMPVMLVTPANSQLAQSLAVAKQVDLHALLSERRYLGLIEQGRHYSPLIQEALKQPDSGLSPASFVQHNPVDILIAKRVDYLLEYPNRVRFIQTSANQPDATLAYFALTNEQPYLTTHVGCSKHPLAAELIERVNHQLKLLWQQPAYLQQMLNWHDPATQQLLQQYIAQLTPGILAAAD